MEWIYILIITITIMEPVNYPDSYRFSHFEEVNKVIWDDIYSLNKKALKRMKLNGTYALGTEISYKIDSTSFKNWAKLID